MKSLNNLRTIAILLLAVGAGCQFIKGEAAATNLKAELDAPTSEKATVKEYTDAASVLDYGEMVATSETKDKIPEVNAPIADSNEEYGFLSEEERMMFEVEEANAEECELEEGADKRSTLCQGTKNDNLRRARGPAYYRTPPAAYYYPRRYYAAPAYAQGPYRYFPRRMEEHEGEEHEGEDHDGHMPPPRSSPRRPSMAPRLQREGNDWVVLFPEMAKHGDHYDVIYNRVTLFKVYDHYLRKYTYTC